MPESVKAKSKEVSTNTNTNTDTASPQIDIATTGNNGLTTTVEPVPTPAVPYPEAEQPTDQSYIIDPLAEEDKKYQWMDAEPYPSNAPNFKYNNLEELEHKKFGFPIPDDIRMSEPKRFLNEVDITKGEIEREITSMWRIYAQDLSDPKRARKEFLFWYENWRGKNWMGADIAPCTGHKQGVYKKLDREPVIDFRTHRITKYKKKIGPICYYVPFNKETVDKIIGDSIGSDQATVLFGIFDGPRNMRLGPLTYEEFTGKSFDECREILRKKQ